MGYKFLEDVAIADIAFDADGKTLSKLFNSAALALTNTMIQNLESIKIEIEKRFVVSSESLELLLLNFLEKFIFYKDSEQLIFGKFEPIISKTETGFKVSCKAGGEKIDSNIHQQLIDVKAVTLHMLEVKQTKLGWKCRVVLDI